jgi:NAD(P)H-hydrate epimerase
MKLVTSEQMRRLEALSAEAGVSTDTLMENAGLAVAQEVWMALGTLEERRILTLVGPGNNGGDGLVAARNLHDWGSHVRCYLLRPRSEGDANLRQVLELGIETTVADDDPGLSTLDAALAEADCVIDALLGTGAARPITGVLAAVLDKLSTVLRRRPAPVIVAVDMPTGVNADTGAVDPAAVPADVTVALGFSKVGLHTLPGAEYAGRLEVVDIGIPAGLGDDLPLDLMTARRVHALLPPRPAAANKGTFGRVMVVAGSRNYAGAARLAVEGAARVGAGLVTLACPESLSFHGRTARLTEATYLPLPEEDGAIAREGVGPLLRAVLDGYQALLVGCGLGQSPSTQAFLRSLLFSLPEDPPFALVIDADGLNALARTPRWWRLLRSPAILTPHPGEMSRLTGHAIVDVQADRLQTAVNASAEWEKTVVLKGAHTVVASPAGRAALSPSANPALASAGTGDVLAGAIAGLAAQGLALGDAALCGVYLHGAAADELRSELGDAGLLASDLLPQLPRTIKGLKTAYAPSDSKSAR